MINRQQTIVDDDTRAANPIDGFMSFTDPPPCPSNDKASPAAVLDPRGRRVRAPLRK
jgi:hypothetical protein